MRAQVLTRGFLAQLRINSSSKWKCQSLANILANDSGDGTVQGQQTVGHMEMDSARAAGVVALGRQV